MPQYVNSPFQVPKLLQKGVPLYLFGSFNSLVGNTNLALTNVALTSNIATVTVQIVNGPMPVVGGLITIINSTASSGVFNVNRAVITGVTIDSATGVGTITFALTNANVSSTANAGTVVVEPAEVGETLNSTTGASMACVVQAPEGDSQFTLSMAVMVTGITSGTFTLQRAIRNNDAEYTNTGVVVTYSGGAYVAGPVVEATLERGYCYRVKPSGVAGTGTVIAKVG